MAAEARTTPLPVSHGSKPALREEVESAATMASAGVIVTLVSNPAASHHLERLGTVGNVASM
jgi:hypothetical protein